MALDIIHKFYCSKAWRDLAQAEKIKSNGVCVRCKNIFNIDELRPHHKNELTLDNITDVNISLNPSNIEVICHDCHNIAHNRFGGTVTHNVYIIHGAPFAGKKTYVKQVATAQDLIVDLDALHNAISLYNGDTTKKTAFSLRDLLIDQIRYRKGGWHNAYIIGAYPLRYDRDTLVKELGAELIYINTSREECIKRVMQNVSHAAVQQAIVGYIENYFGRYTE
jgi:predicted kinase